MTTTETKIAALKQAVASSPEYAEIVPLFIGLYEQLLGREHETGITIHPSTENLSERSRNGFPVLSPTDLHVEREQAASFLAKITSFLCLMGRENKEYLGLLAAALQAGTIEPAAIFPAILERRRAPVTEAAGALGIPAALVEFVFEIPLKTSLESFAAGYGPDAFPEWTEGYCPVCGSRAAMSELTGEEGRRHLCCSTCTFRWPFKRLTCPYCGNDDPDKQSYFTVDEGPCRVDTCRACSRYIKTRDSRKGHGGVPLEVEDMTTIHLDLLAVREGFERGK